jgi:hypothetical protein
VALNFPSSPTVGQVFTDSTSGNTYRWTGTYWKSYSTVNPATDFDVVNLNVSGVTSTRNLRVTGITTLGIATVGIITAFEVDVSGVTTTQHLQVTGVTTAVNISASGISTIGTLNVSGVTTTQHLRVTGVTTAVNISASGISTVGTLNVSGVTTSQHLRITGVTTFSDGVQISGIASVGTAITMYPSTGIISATRYYGDGSSLTGVIGIGFNELDGMLFL